MPRDAPPFFRSFRPARHLLAALIGALLCIGAAATRAGPAIEPLPLDAQGGWVRETPPNRRVAAGYVRLRNHSESSVTLRAFESPVARVELHEMRTEDGMMRMRRLEKLAIPAGAIVDLAPGGLHLMLFDVDATRAGVRVPVVLIDDLGRRLPVELPVRRTPPQGD